MLKLIQLPALTAVVFLAACSGNSDNALAPVVPEEVTDATMTAAETLTDSETETGTGTVAETGADSGTNDGTDAGAESGADAGTDSGADAGTDSSADAGTDTGADAGTDASVDAGTTDAGADAGTDTGADAGTDTGADAGTDAGADAGTDAGADAGTTDAGADAGTDAGADAGTDAGADAGETDTGTDGGTDSGMEQPGPEEPGPEQPGPEQPGPEQPGPEQPGPEQPGPEQPGPEQPGPEQPGPDGEGPDGDSIPGQDLIGDTTVENFSTADGISLNIIRFATNQSGSPQLELQLNNNSSTAIFNGICEVTALQDDQVRDVTSTIFVNGAPIDSGESAINIADFAELGDGYSSINKLRLGCEWSDGDNGRRDIVNGEVTVAFTAYSSESDRPTVGLLLTNNSGNTINNAVCIVEAKRENLIADVAEVVFAENGNIDPGAAVEAAGAWTKLNSLDDFDSDPFNISNVNCQYQ